MIKLNNKGWGIGTFLILLGILLLALLIAAKLINDIGGSLPLAVKDEDRIKRELSYSYVDFYAK